MTDVASLISKVQSGRDLSIDQSDEVIHAIMRGQVPNAQISELLLGFKSKGEVVDEIAGAARALRRNMTPIKSTRGSLVDTCGTGGDGSNTFNISTAAALVAAAAGIAVAKHGNRKVSSKTGSADALLELGVDISANVATVEKCLEKVGVCFCFAPLFHSSMKNVAQVRKELGVPTIFNMLGPLCNPAGAEHQVLGVGNPAFQEKIASALAKLGTKRSVVVYGTDQLCEISNAQETRVFEVIGDSISETVWSPENFGLSRSDRAGLIAEDPTESARLIREVLEGAASAARDVVVMNAAAAIWLTGKATTLVECAEIAQRAIDTGAAKQTLKALGELSHSA